MSPHVNGSAATTILFVLLLVLLFATARALAPPSSFGNFDSAIGPSSFGNLDPASGPSSFGNFPRAPASATSPDLPAVAAEFVRQFSVAHRDGDAVPYRDTS